MFTRIIVHVYTDADIYRHTQKIHIHLHIHAHMHALLHICMAVGMHTAHAHIHTHAHMHTLTYKLIHAYTDACTHTTATADTYRHILSQCLDECDSSKAVYIYTKLNEQMLFSFFAFSTNLPTRDNVIDLLANLASNLTGCLLPNPFCMLSHT